MGDAMTNHPALRTAVNLPDATTLSTMLQMSEALFTSGLLPAHVKSTQAAFAIVQKGVELGIPPMHALSNIAVIQGKPTCNSELMLALIYRDHGDDAVRFLETTGEACRVAYKRRGWSDYAEHAYTAQDAKVAGLSGGNWAKYPGAMLRARCVSAVARMAFPDTIGGMYLPDEVGGAVTVDADGGVVADHRATLPIDAGRSDAALRATVIEGRVVDDDTGEIVGAIESGGARPSPQLLHAELQRRLKGAHAAEDLAAVGAWAERMGLAADDEAVAAFKERRRELRAAARQAGQTSIEDELRAAGDPSRRATQPATVD